MASGYITSDGKDLDARYLGINSKAASAKIADTATTATTAGKLSQRAVAYRNGNVIEATVPSYTKGTYYTSPTSGLLVHKNSSGMSINDNYDFEASIDYTVEVGSDSDSFSFQTAFVQTGDKLQYGSRFADATVMIIPFYVQ